MKYQSDRDTENAAQPYQAIVYIGGMQYGVGYGSSKRQAKSAAARASIHILIPEMKDELDAAGPQNTDKTQPDFHVSSLCKSWCTLASKI